jgi:NAD(P)-dependent dehydrogenase (short-subunit alcohol dehydrogenase family)
MAWMMREYASSSHRRQEAIDMANRDKTVLITGASTGIGEACAMYLTRCGWRVFAGVRKKIDAEALTEKSFGSLTPVFLDVSDQEAIAVAAAEVQEMVGDLGLDALVNNAGIAVAGPLEFVPVDYLRRQLEVNVVGQIAVTQAFLPHLRRAQGRVILMGSVSGRCSLPLFGPYCASKFALEAIADALRLELRPWGMHVAIVEPGATKTSIWGKGAAQNQVMLAGLPAKAGKLYGDMLRRLDEIVRHTSETALPPTRIAKVVEHALTTHHPRARYLIGGMGRVQLVLDALPTRVRDHVLATYVFNQQESTRHAHSPHHNPTCSFSSIVE